MHFYSEIENYMTVSGQSEDEYQKKFLKQESDHGEGADEH